MCFQSTVTLTTWTSCFMTQSNKERWCSYTQVHWPAIKLEHQIPMKTVHHLINIYWHSQWNCFTTSERDSLHIINNMIQYHNQRSRKPDTTTGELIMVLVLHHLYVEKVIPHKTAQLFLLVHAYCQETWTLEVKLHKSVTAKVSLTDTLRVWGNVLMLMQILATGEQN